MADLQSLLSENSMKKYYIEYNGFLSNHICHAIFALYKLGATVEQIQRFVSQCTAHVIIIFKLLSSLVWY